ncbi:MAG: FecR domain-containing protein [Candidatus Sericytochromatia bacterium]|nr:FecR domain-containing protein [Candidatus Sericytochromatia bacterium]
MRALLPHVALALVAVGLLAAPSAAVGEATAPTATLLEVAGPVTWRADGRAPFKDARGGELLFTGAVVRTGPKGQARLRWRNGGDFRLMPLSELEIPADEGVLLKLGKVWASFQEKLLAPFYFRSPSATAVVRGTILAVGLAPDGTTEVEVLEGRVEVASRQGGPARMLEPGQSLIVAPFGPLGPIQPVRPDVPRLYERRLPAPEQPGREPAPAGAFDWLRQQRAAVRLEPMREVERGRHGRRPPQPEGQPHPDLAPGPQPDRPPHPEDDGQVGQRSGVFLRPRGGRGLEARPRAGDATDRRPLAADPAYAFPAGRPPGHGPQPPRCAPPNAPPEMRGQCPPEPPPGAPGPMGPGGRP